jgi:hypothetical protein
VRVPESQILEKITVIENSLIWGGEPTGPIWTILGTLSVLNYVINCANFGIDRCEVFYSARG